MPSLRLKAGKKCPNGRCTLMAEPIPMNGDATEHVQADSRTLERESLGFPTACFQFCNTGTLSLTKRPLNLSLHIQTLTDTHSFCKSKMEKSGRTERDRETERKTERDCTCLLNSQCSIFCLSCTFRIVDSRVSVQVANTKIGKDKWASSKMKVHREWFPTNSD